MQAGSFPSKKKEIKTCSHGAITAVVYLSQGAVWGIMVVIVLFDHLSSVQTELLAKVLALTDIGK